jgi:fructose-1,6-bisphosphatase I
MDSRPKFITLERFIIEQEEKYPTATGEFTSVLHGLTLAAKLIWREVSKAGLVNILGTTEQINFTGDILKKLDLFADETMYKTMYHSGHLCAMASEESNGLIEIPKKYLGGNYILTYDPLDGSSNIDANITIGTIFGIYRRISNSGHGTLEDCLQPGYKQIAAGYIIYGTSTMFVYTTGQGVHGFTLDPSVGEFLLSHENITIPKKGKTYSINEGNYYLWDSKMQEYVQYLKQIDSATDRPYSLRYIGTMVGDIHRTLLYGGIFIYPADQNNPDGKLRLMYECNPMAFVMEQAGGKASTGKQRILDIVPTSLHMRTPIIIGSTNDVTLCEEFIANTR